MITREQIEEAKEQLGDRNFNEITDVANCDGVDEVKGRCLCPCHDDVNPSMMYDRKRFRVKCFACGATFDVISARQKFLGETFKQAAEYLLSEAGVAFEPSETDIADLNPPHEEHKAGEEVVEYLKTRCISEETVRDVGIQQDDYGNIAFPYRDQNDTLLLMKYRPARKVQKGENKSWCQKDATATPILFNMNHVTLSEPLVICEGEIDCCALIESGVRNAVSIPLGAKNHKYIDKCWEFLNQFKEIVICFDNDDAGKAGRSELAHRLGIWRVKSANIPKVVQDNDGIEHKTKDVNEVLYYAGKEKVRRIISDAVECKIENATDTARIPDIDLCDIECIPTGLKPLDAITKMYVGTLLIVSGTPGSGKSSWLSQICCNLADRGIPSFIFSGELPSWLSKQWSWQIFAGPKNCTRQVDESGAVTYSVPKDIRQKINEYYGDMIFTYNDDADNTPDAILETAELLVRRKGCKVCIIDNLAVLDLHTDEENLNLATTNFISRLIKFARQFNVCVLLVAHPRKLFGADLDIYSVAGTSNISNLCHQLIGIKRVTDAERAGVLNRNGDGYIQPPFDYHVKVSIIKDRLSGHAGAEVGLYYDPASRRFFWDEESYKRNYHWSGDAEEYNNEVMKYPIVGNVERAFDQ